MLDALSPSFESDSQTGEHCEIKQPVKLSLKPQEIPFDHSDCNHFFTPSSELPFVATPAAIRRFGWPAILSALKQLQMLAILHDGLDRLQIFEPERSGESLWFIEDEPGGGITAMLPSDY